MKDRDVIILALEDAIVSTVDLLTNTSGYTEEEIKEIEKRLKEYRRILKKRTGEHLTSSEKALSKFNSVSIEDLPKEDTEWHVNL